MKNKKLYTSSYQITDIEHILRLPTAYVLIKKSSPAYYIYLVYNIYVCSASSSDREVKFLFFYISIPVCNKAITTCLTPIA